MSCKRNFPNQDPDYEQIPLQSGNKRLKLIENDAKIVTVRKIDSIIRRQFEKEINLKESEIEAIDDRLYQVRQLVDNLRAALVINFYSAANQTSTSQPLPGKVGPPASIHPAVKKFVGKTPRCSQGSYEDQLSREISQDAFGPSGSQSQSPVIFNTRDTSTLSSPAPVSVSQNQDPLSDEGSRAARFKVKKRIVVGNISKYIPVDKRDDKDQSTHKWMVYVRGPRHEPGINPFVKKVWFFLHPTYRPNDLVEVSQPPFHLTRRGWGEFPVRVQLHFYDQRNKRVDIIHTLKLDKTFTGLQTLGAETVVDILLYKPDVRLGLDYSRNSDLHLADQTDEQSSLDGNPCNQKEITNEVKNTQFFSSDFDHQYWKKQQSECAAALGRNSAEISTESPESVDELNEVIPEGDCLTNPVTEDNVTVPNNLSGSTSSSKEDSCGESADKSPTPGNGLATFVKCVDKQGNFYLVPYSAFLKLHSLQGGAAMVVSATSVQHAGSSIPVATGPKLVSLISQGNSITDKPTPSAVSPSTVVKTVAQQNSASGSQTPQNLILTGGKAQKYVADTCPVTATRQMVKRSKQFQAGRSILKPRHDNGSTAMCEDSRQRLNIDECATMDEVVRHFVKQRPLGHPVCATTVDKFLSWNIGKRCAAEWQRARAVQKDIWELVPKSCNWKVADIWTVKKILIWARHYGYTPVKSGLHNSLSDATDAGEDDVDVAKLDTYTTAELVFKTLQERETTVRQVQGSDSSDDEVDVTGLNESRTKRQLPSPAKNNSQSCKILYTKKTDFVRDTSLQVDVKLKPTRIVEGVEGPVAEELIYSAMKQFMEDLLRNSLAKAFQRVHSNRNPESLLLMDVVNMLCELPLCDFLTNRHIGKSDSGSSWLNHMPKF